jgi:hypothetical protein
MGVNPPVCGQTVAGMPLPTAFCAYCPIDGLGEPKKPLPSLKSMVNMGATVVG